MPTPHDMGSCLVEAQTLIEAGGRDESRLQAELLAAHVFAVHRLRLPECARSHVAEAVRARFLELARRVAAGEPMQYVLGETEFRGRRFACDRRALIPRPETEELVDLVAGLDALWSKPEPRLVDVGTGTGCIAISLALEQAAAHIFGVDVSADALALARANAEHLGVGSRIEWVQGDLLEAFAPCSLEAVVSNPPYVAAAELAELAREIRDFEPRLALDGGIDGLDIIRRLIAQAFQKLRPDGSMVIEMGEKQGAAVSALLAEAGYTGVTVVRDLAGHDRFAVGRKP